MNAARVLSPWRPAALPRPRRGRNCGGGNFCQASRATPLIYTVVLRTLLIRPGGIGDCILSFPAMQAMAAGETEVWITGSVAPLVRFASPVRPLASTGIDLLGLPGVDPPSHTIGALRRFDSIVSWYGTNRPEFREAVATLGLPFRFLDALPAHPAGIHAADFYLHKAGFEGPAIPRIPCERTPGDYAVIHPFSGSPRKNWPLDRFRALAARLPMPVRWTAGPEEVLEDAVRFDSLSDLARWLAGARFYIGNDSGITHLAAAVGAPVIAIFGPTDPSVWGPRGELVHLIHRPGAWPEVDDVARLAAVL